MVVGQDMVRRHGLCHGLWKTGRDPNTTLRVDQCINYGTESQVLWNGISSIPCNIGAKTYISVARFL